MPFSILAQRERLLKADTSPPRRLNNVCGLWAPSSPETLPCHWVVRSCPLLMFGLPTFLDQHRPKLIGAKELSWLSWLPQIKKSAQCPFKSPSVEDLAPALSPQKHTFWSVLGVTNPLSMLNIVQKTPCVNEQMERVSFLFFNSVLCRKHFRGKPDHFFL